MSKYEAIHTHVDTYTIEQNSVDLFGKFNKIRKKTNGFFLEFEILMVNYQNTLHEEIEHMVSIFCIRRMRNFEFLPF